MAPGAAGADVGAPDAAAPSVDASGVDAVVVAAVAAIDTDELVELTSFLAAEPTPWGAEAATAERLAAWLAARWPELRLTVDRFGDDGESDDGAVHDGRDGAGAVRANLLVDVGDADAATALALYAHLDTTLRGDAVDALITGNAAPVPPIRVDGDALVGLGLSVAKAPVAAALVALAAAARGLAAAGADFRLQCLLTAGGTHRLAAREPGARPVPADGAALEPIMEQRAPGQRSAEDHSGRGRGTFGAGARRALAQGFAPAAVLNVKGGAPAPLAAEPGAAYLSVRVVGEWEPALFRGDHPGVVAALGPLVDTVESWRRDVLQRQRRSTLVGREIALGSVQVGDPTKPDLLPAELRGRVFVVLAAGDDPQQLADELAARLVTGLTAAGLVGYDVAVAVDAADAAAATASDAAIVALVDAAWRRRFGPPPEVAGWRGSTDGVTFRAAGIPTVRVGPLMPRDHDDDRLDRVAVADLVAFAELYAEIAVRWFAATR